jgi:hypothetical protein
MTDDTAIGRALVEAEASGAERVPSVERVWLVAA